MTVTGRPDWLELLRMWTGRAAVGAVAVLVAVAIAGCAVAPPVEEEEEEKEEVKQEVVEEKKPEPVVEKKPEPPPPLEFERLFFDYNKAVLRKSSKESLKLAVDQLLARPEVKINVEGHCDERGTDEYNIDLGWKRAYAVRDYLKRLGVDEARIFPISFGRARPATIGHDEEAWSRNRRVELAERK